MNTHQKTYDHFSRVSSSYRKMRTTDKEPIIFISESLKNLFGVKAADVGCGAGRYDLLLFQNLNKLHLTCIDINDSMLQEASNYLKNSGFSNFQTIKANANEIPLEKNSLDCIFTFNAIHHFKINEFAKECNRVLKNNGLLFIYTRSKDQNESNIWGKFFPDFSKKENRLFDNHSLTERISNQTSLNLKSTESFQHDRSSDIQTLVSKAEKKHYSTFSLYTVSEFEKSLGKFKQNIYHNFSNPENIQWFDGNTMFVFQKTIPN